MELTSQEKEHRRNIVLGHSIADIIDTFGSVVNEYLKGYDGIDYETGKIEKGLYDVARSRINPKFENANINQQAGFCAEHFTKILENEQKLKLGDFKTRTERTDDIVRQSDGFGNFIGGKNEELYDIADVDRYGNYIVGSGRQLKYFGNSADDCFRKLLSDKCEKYIEAGVKIEIPLDYYDDVVKLLNNKEHKINKEIGIAIDKNNNEIISNKRVELRRIRNLKESLKCGKLTKGEARFVRLNPKLATAKEIVRNSNEAGIDSGKRAALYGGVMAALSNYVDYRDGKKSLKKAIDDTGKEAVSSAWVGYGTGFLGTVIKGRLQHSDSSVARNLSNSSFPAMSGMMLMTTMNIISKYYRGEMTGKECFEAIGEYGFTSHFASMTASVGTRIAGVAGGTIGGLVGYFLAAASYKITMGAIKEARLAETERKRVANLCLEHFFELKAYQKELRNNFEAYKSRKENLFIAVIDGMNEAMQLEDIDGYIESVNKLTIHYGGEPLFGNMDEFENLMKSNETIII